MALRLSWKALLASACCISLVGCAPWKPWTGSKAAPANSAAPAAVAGTRSHDNLDRLLNDGQQPRSKPPARTASKSSLNPFKGDSSKKDAARQSEIESQLALARLGERRGEADGAKQLYLQLIEKYPENVTPYHRLGIVYARENNFAEANVYFEQAVAMGSPSTDLLSDYGYCLYLESRYDEAERVLRVALQQRPNHEASCNNLGLTLGAMGRYAEALEIFQRVNSEAEAHANLAYIFSQHGDLENAKHGYLEALSKDNKLRQAALAVLQVDQKLKVQERERARLAQQAANHPQPPVQPPMNEPSHARPPIAHSQSQPPAAQPTQEVADPRMAERPPQPRPAPREEMAEPQIAPRMAERAPQAPPVPRREAPPAVAMPQPGPVEEEETVPPVERQPEPRIEIAPREKPRAAPPAIVSHPSPSDITPVESPRPAPIKPQPKPEESAVPFTGPLEPRSPRVALPLVNVPPAATRPAAAKPDQDDATIEAAPGRVEMLENPHVQQRPAPVRPQPELAVQSRPMLPGVSAGPTSPAPQITPQKPAEKSSPAAVAVTPAPKPAPAAPKADNAPEKLTIIKPAPVRPQPPTQTQTAPQQSEPAPVALKPIPKPEVRPTPVNPWADVAEQKLATTKPSAASQTVTPVEKPNELVSPPVKPAPTPPAAVNNSVVVTKREPKPAPQRELAKEDASPAPRLDSRFQPRNVRPTTAPAQSPVVAAEDKKHSEPSQVAVTPKPLEAKPMLPTVVPPMIEKVEAKPPGQDSSSERIATKEPASTKPVEPARTSPFVPKPTAPPAASASKPSIAFEEGANKPAPSEAPVRPKLDTKPMPVANAAETKRAIELLTSKPVAKPESKPVEGPKLESQSAPLAATRSNSGSLGLSAMVKPSNGKSAASVETKPTVAKTTPEPTKPKPVMIEPQVESVAAKPAPAPPAKKPAPTAESKTAEKSQLASLGASINAAAPVKSAAPAKAMKPAIVEEVAARPQAAKVVTIARAPDEALPPIVSADEYAEQHGLAKRESQAPVRVAQLPERTQRPSGGSGLGGFVNTSNGASESSSLPPIISTDDYQRQRGQLR
jgi:tetratricopeptide (TPR) repeat protein